MSAPPFPARRALLGAFACLALAMQIVGCTLHLATVEHCYGERGPAGHDHASAVGHEHGHPLPRFAGHVDEAAEDGAPGHHPAEDHLDEADEPLPAPGGDPPPAALAPAGGIALAAPALRPASEDVAHGTPRAPPERLRAPPRAPPVTA